MKDVLLNSRYSEYLKHEKPAGVGSRMVQYVILTVKVAAVIAFCVGVLIWINVAFHLRLPEHLPVTAAILGGIGW